VKMVYIIENNGVYGLTKGQMSASADIGSRPKKGEANALAPIDPVTTALSLGATFVARSFSGRQGTVGTDCEGSDRAQRLRAHRRHLAMRNLQRPRGFDQELQVHARPRSEGSSD